MGGGGVEGGVCDLLPQYPARSVPLGQERSPALFDCSQAAGADLVQLHTDNRFHERLFVLD